MNKEIETKFGFKMLLDPSDEMISAKIREYGYYDKVGSGILKEKLKNEDIFVDIGAHIGWFTLLASKYVGDNGHVYAFEPEPNNFELLNNNVELNGFKNITAIQKAIIDKSETLNFYLSKHNTGNHRIYDINNGRTFIKVQSTSLDEYFKANNNKIDFIKIDIQGAEIRALRGMSEILKKNKRLKMYIEFWPWGIKKDTQDPKEFIDLLIKNKFKIYLADDRSCPLNIEKINSLFNAIKYRGFKNLFCSKEIYHG